MKCRLFDIDYDYITMTQAVERAEEMLAEPGVHYVVTPNTEMAWRCRKDARLKKAIAHADLVLPDGIGVVYGARILKSPLPERVPGIDFISNVLEKTAGKGEHVFLLGSKPGVADMAAENLKAKYPGLDICGIQHGYFDDTEQVIRHINASGATILLVCLGFPKQEYWMIDHRQELTTVRLMAGLGGSMDVFAGTAKRAPEKWQKLGIEWLYRLLEDPKRIKRMSVLPAFMFSVIWQRITGKGNK